MGQRKEDRERIGKGKEEGAGKGQEEEGRDGSRIEGAGDEKQSPSDAAAAD